MLTIIYPSLFNELSEPFKTEYTIAKNLGLKVQSFDEETFKIKTKDKVLYRGWMISSENYKKLNSIVSLEEYEKASYIQNWYPALKEYTFKTIIKDDITDSDFENKSYFIRDSLKSLGAIKSIAHNKNEASHILLNISKNRDFKIESNKVCLREIKEITDEERFFAINGKVITNKKSKKIDFANKIAALAYKELSLKMISIDIAIVNNKEKLIEIGDLQVSDISKDGSEKEIFEFYKAITEHNLF